MDTEQQRKLEGLEKFLMNHAKSHHRENDNELYFLKNGLREKFINMAEPMNRVTYKRKNYDKLFPDGKADTPKGEIKLRRDQYSKPGSRDGGNRKRFLGGMEQTYKDPIAIIGEEKNGKLFKLFGKSFTNFPKNKALVSVVDDKNTGITTHPKGIDDFLGKINSPENLLYEKQENGAPYNDQSIKGRAAGNDTQLPINIPQIPPVVNGEIKDKE